MSNLYDVSNWKPLTHALFAEEMAEASCTLHEPEALVTKVETLPDGRVRLVTWCEIKHNVTPDVSDIEPYLMLIYDPEVGGTVALRRTDVTLATA